MRLNGSDSIVLHKARYSKSVNVRLMKTPGLPFTKELMN